MISNLTRCVCAQGIFFIKIFSRASKKYTFLKTYKRNEKVKLYFFTVWLTEWIVIKKVIVMLELT